MTDTKAKLFESLMPKAKTAAEQRGEIRLNLLGMKTHELSQRPVAITEKALLSKAALAAPVIQDDSPILQLRGHGLVPEDFVFDESQLAALHSLSHYSHGSLIGAAGTGKTTCTKAFVQHIADQVNSIDANYSERLKNEANGKAHNTKMIPSILLCSFTGRAVRQIKKNFPLAWHSNIMTIHRALRFAPVDYEEMDPVTMKMYNKRIFEPQHTNANPMPWSIIIIDEASMLSVGLWQQLLDATKPGTRIYMIGDLNQLPPVIGKSVFGFALTKWNIAELTHVHRQKGSNDSIVPNAHRILRGEMPEEGVNFKMREISQYPKAAQQQVLHLVKAMHAKGVYNPLYDGIITAVNGVEWSSPSAPLGQIPLNDPLSLYFNQTDESGQPRQRMLIDAARSKKIFAIGDKVMATKNDYDAGITNGMMGIITDITLNEGYIGDVNYVGDYNAVQERIKALKDEIATEINTEDLLLGLEQDVAANGRDKKKEESLQGAASHSITVDFRACEPGAADDTSDDSTRYVTFTSRSEVETLQLAYASTCHKMQGAECPTTIVICHEAFGRMLNREWLYTACTRASEKMLLLYTQKGLLKALGTQNIKGKTITEKAANFQKLMQQIESGRNGKANLIASLDPKLPDPWELDSQARKI